MKIKSIKELVSEVNKDLGDTFCDNFRYKRKELGQFGRASSSGILFKFIDPDRDWVINEGGGSEIQYHLYFRKDEIGYGLGFNAQYVPFANDKSPVDYIKPFVDAFLALKKHNDKRIKDLEDNGFSLIEGDWSDMNNIQVSDYFLFGKIINIQNGIISDKEYSDMLNNIKTGLYDLYIAIWEQKNKTNQTQTDMNKYLQIILKCKNLILTGAPGTGKTYLAKQIAQQMIFGDVKENMTEEEQKQFDEQCGFVQFHPSYDYTDFVEGLRPKQDDNENIGFERKDGVFKDFCKKALESSNSNINDNFNTVWDKLIDYLNNNDHLDIPLLSGKKTIRIELNEYGTGLAERTYENEKYVGTSEWIKGQSKFFSKEQLYNIYRGLPGIPSRGHDNYRKAIVKYMKENLGLTDFNIGQSVDNKENNHYVFIIDEINRGEISKIFGELFFSIDPGYRGKEGKVRTQYSNMQTTPNDFDTLLGITDPNNCGHFFVPENVYIIGTLNDIDRSVESMDFAFRRRFAFVEIKANENIGMLDQLGDNKEKAINRMKNLNNMIWHETKDNESDEKKCIEGLSSAYHIGASYFLKLKNYNEDDAFEQLWENHLEGLLREYMRGMPDLDVENNIKKLKAAYDNESVSDN